MPEYGTPTEGSVCSTHQGFECGGRTSLEQVCGRLVHHYTETFKKGTSKSVAVLVDDNALRSVLVLEAWSVADQTHMQNAADRLATSQTKKRNGLLAKGVAGIYVILTMICHGGDHSK